MLFFYEEVIRVKRYLKQQTQRFNKEATYENEKI